MRWRHCFRNIALMLLYVNVARMIVFFTFLSVALASNAESRCKWNNWQYQHTLTETRSGISCQRWDSQSPHQHRFTDASYFPDETIADAGNSCRNPDNEIYAWCYTTDANKRWEFCDIIKCSEEMESQCAEENLEYQQTLTQTHAGIPCQRWDSQSPHQHCFTNDGDFTNETIADAGNFCRNPDNELYAWCYTTDANKRWDYCDILYCTDDLESQCEEDNWQYQHTLTETRSGISCQRWDSQSPHQHRFTDASYFPDETIADAGNSCRNPDNEIYAWCYTTDANKRWEFCDNIKCSEEMESQCAEENFEYQQTLTQTHAGIPCQRWDSQSPHQHRFINDGDFPNETIADAGNFCRNPDNELYAWCYTTDANKRWDYCDILYCTDEKTIEDCRQTVKSENWQYQQTLNETHSGISCQRWDSQSPHEHSMTDASAYPDETIADAGNSCRNPDNEPYAWCYTTDENIRWEYCDILQCAEDEENQ